VPKSKYRPQARSAARLAAVQALYQQEMEGTALARLLDEFHMLRAATYELIARADVPTKSIISEYVDVADAFYGKRETGFVNGLLDSVSRDARPA
jgi:N utilization substance protein B